MKCDDSLDELCRLVEADAPDLQDALLESLRHPWQHVRILQQVS